jgi:predicted dinucleotide-binding enzyme
MKLSTLGAGRIAKAFTKHAAAAGHNIVMSNRTATSLDSIVKEFGPGVEAGNLKQVLDAEIILLAIPWTEIEGVLSNVKTWNGQIILDATNAITFPGFKPLDLGGKASSEIVAEMAKGAKVIKAFNTLEAATLAADPRECGGNRVIFISGDDEPAKKKVLSLLQGLGFSGVDLGNLAASKIQQFGEPLALKNFIQLDR